MLNSGVTKIKWWLQTEHLTAWKWTAFIILIVFFYIYPKTNTSVLTGEIIH